MKKNLFSLSFFILALGMMAQTPRMSLVEEFTGETCPPCAAYNPAFNVLLSQNLNKVIAIKWQVPIPSAPSNAWSLYQTNKAEINWRYSTYGYGINSAPSVRIDGQMPTVFGAAGQNITQQNATVFSNAQAIMSEFSVTMNRAWNKTCTAITLTVNITATAPFTSVGNLVFRTVMVEEMIQFATQPGTNGEKKFEDVAIKSFPSIQNGVAMSNNWIVGQTQTFTLNCPIPSYCRKKEEIAFVGFIQDDGNRKVAQAVRAGKAALPADAVSGISSRVGIACSAVISPTVEIKNESASNTITNLTLTPYVDGVAAAPVAWSGNIAPGASDMVTLSNLTTPVLAGSHSFSCDIEMANTPYNVVSNTTKVSYIVVAGNYQGTPVAESFSSTTYPPAGFGVINPNNGPGWSRVTGTGGYNASSEATKYDFFNNSVIGDQDDLFLPPMDLSASSGAQMTFDLAYAQRNLNSNDALELLVSHDCGATWTSVYNASGQGLATAAPVAFAYFPDSQNPAHWRTEFVDLSAYNQPDLMIKFVATSDNGNNLYLDNINLSFSDGTGIKNVSAFTGKVNMYPNPTSGNTQLKMDNMKAGPAKISVMNTLGQEVFVKEVSLTQGSNTVDLDLQGHAAGIYNISINANGGTLVKKLTLTK